MGIFVRLKAAQTASIALILFCAGVPIAAAAQDTAQDNNTITYDQNYFAQYRPVTLEDMIRNIPGGATVMSDLRRGMDNRGFGSSGAPILINGRRMSGKANDMATSLARIQATQVKYIELIRGNAEGLDIKNEGTLFNVILSESAENSSSNFVEAAVNYVRETPLKPEVLLSHTGQRNSLEYGISYQLDTKPMMLHQDENVINPDGSLREYRHQATETDITNHKLTGTFAYAFDNGNQIRLNGLYSKDDQARQALEDRFWAGAGGARTFYALDESLFDFEKEKWEIGGDFKGDVGFLGSLQALFVLNRASNLDAITQDLTENDITDRYFYSDADYDEGETIIRVSTTTPLFSGQSLEWGAEGAFNTLDRTYSFEGDPAENAVVKEDRYELFGTHSLSITDGLQLQSALIAEFSKIAQTRDTITNSRSFDYLKPRFELRYDYTSRDQMRLVAERTVSQLNLNDFVASRNEEDESINFGNPNLVPDKTWKFTIGYEHRFADNAGSFKAEVFYKDISDLIDKIEISELSSGVGNIGDAKELGAEVEASIRFGAIGIPNALLTLTYKYNDSEATDPFTGRKRIVRFTTPHYWNVDFRHDMPEWDLAWGASAHKRSRMERHDIAVQETALFKRHVFAFVEYAISSNIKIRIDANHFLRDIKMHRRTYYDGHIADGNIERIDDQVRKANVDYMIKLQASF